MATVSMNYILIEFYSDVAIEESAASFFRRKLCFPKGQLLKNLPTSHFDERKIVTRAILSFLARFVVGCDDVCFSLLWSHTK